jgi:hypothetical protein
MRARAQSHFAAAFGVRRWLAVVLLSIALGYPLAWQADPYIFGFAVLAFVPLQLAVALAGILARITKLDPVGGFRVWLIDGLLIGCAAGALTAVRSISWA